MTLKESPRNLETGRNRSRLKKPDEGDRKEDYPGDDPAGGICQQCCKSSQYRSLYAVSKTEGMISQNGIEEGWSDRSAKGLHPRKRGARAVYAGIADKFKLWELGGDIPPAGNGAVGISRSRNFLFTFRHPASFGRRCPEKGDRAPVPPARCGIPL